MAISQDDRLIRIDTPLGNETFVVLAFNGTEAISRMFNFSLELASERNDITFDQMAGSSVTVRIRSDKSKDRLFNGIIIAFAPVEVSGDQGYSLYRAVMAPALWGLTECYDCRIFQDKDVKDIISEVLSRGSLGSKKIDRSIDYRLDLAGAFVQREYCVQYGESDFDFISRLCEEEGIFYFFEHTEDGHVLVFADSPDQHRPYAAGAKETVTFQKSTGAYLEDHVITALHANKKMTAALFTARDYNFATPNTDMTVTRPSLQQETGSEGEIYMYPGGYTVGSSAGESLAKIRMQARDAQICNIRGQGNSPDFIPGCTFKLREHPLKQMNGQGYVLAMVHHQARQDFRSGASDGDQYYNSFNCIPHSVPFRPEQSTPKPLIVSSQTAIVTGPKAEEIHTDVHGRVKVKFHWDRRKDEKGDGNMSCWIRVSQNWAGNQWGALHIPRVGQEVIINFLDGDPDRPIITGRVYHGKNLPPYDLPAHKTRSTIKSNSSKNGNGNGNSNEICFEDLTGKEEFYTHAARNQKEVVENDISTQVKANQTIKVEKDRSLMVASGNETITIAGGARTVAVKAGEKHTNSAGFNHKVAADYTLKVNGNITIDASGLVRITGARIILNG
jgi:type VI secretion system secreted protein VgrG